MNTIEQRYAKLLELTQACAYYLEGTDNEDPVALVSYLDAIHNEVPVVVATPTSGHCANSMGVRGHSAGDIFPATIMIVGTFTKGFDYHILNHPRLNKEYPYGNYEAAHMAAQCTSRF